MGHFYVFDGETLEVAFGRWGRYLVQHGGRDVARGRSFFGRRSRAAFSVNEGGRKIAYNLEIRAMGGLGAPRIEIRRNGQHVAGWR